MATGIDETAGTLSGEGGNAQATGTPLEDDRDANVEAGESAEELRARIADLEREKQQHLIEKTNAESTKRELAEAQRRLAERESTAPTTDPFEAEAERAFERLSTRGLAELRRAANDPENPYQAIAQAQLDSMTLMHRDQRLIQERVEKSAVPESEREEVEKLFATGAYTSRQVAREHYRKTAELNARIAELEKGTKLKERETAGEEVRAEPAMSVRGVSVREAAGAAVKYMPIAEYNAYMANEAIPDTKKVELKNARAEGRVRTQ